MPLSRFIEEIRLGVLEDPHLNHPIVLTEKVTVCPSCRSLRSLRHEEEYIICVECAWNTPNRDTQAA